MDDLILAGDVRYSNIARELYNNEESKNQAKFLFELQSIKIKYGVVKLDTSLGAFKQSSHESGL